MELKTIKILILVIVIATVGFIVVASALASDEDVPLEQSIANLSPAELTDILPPLALNDNVVESDDLMSKVEKQIEDYVFKFTNEERVKNGLPPLILDAELSAIAKAHAEDMAARDYYEHNTPEGQYPTDRAREAGYALHKDLEGGFVLDGISENIHKMTYGILDGFYVGKYESEELARKLVKDWMSSEGHRSNILRDIHTHIGIGVAYDGKKWYYAVQDFW